MRCSSQKKKMKKGKRRKINVWCEEAKQSAISQLSRAAQRHQGEIMACYFILPARCWPVCLGSSASVCQESCKIINKKWNAVMNVQPQPRTETDEACIQEVIEKHSRPGRAPRGHRDTWKAHTSRQPTACIRTASTPWFHPLKDCNTFSYCFGSSV